MIPSSIVAVVVALGAAIALVEGGNYLPCYEDEANSPYCHDDEGGETGLCMIMSTSPSPYKSSGSKAYSRTSFHISAEAVTWFEANDHCRREFDSPLFDPTSDPVDISMAEDYVAHIRGQVGGLEGVDQGVWTGVVDDVGQCQMLRLSDFRFFFTSCTSHYNALCQSIAKGEQKTTEEEEDDDAAVNNSRYMYTCRCPDGYGYENCTRVSDEGDSTAGITYCTSGNNWPAGQLVPIHAFNPGSVVFIDHASYGRPFWLETAGVSPTFCPEESFAGTEKSYCVASNTLAAVLYWCQGKEGCEVDPAFLLDMATFKNFFLVYRDSGLEHAHHSDFYGASAECTNHGGAIAFPATDEHMAELVRLLAETDDAQGFWLDPRAAKVRSTRKRLADGSAQYEDQCLVLLPSAGVTGSAEPVIRWVPCFHTNGDKYRSACEAKFGGFEPAISAYSSQFPSGRSGAGMGRRDNNPDDHSCMLELPLEDTMFEYRYHEDQLDKKSPSCSMKVDYRQENTCYKETTLMTWSEARRTCWVWGGELAFPLTGASYCSETGIYREQTEELWLANDKGCNEARCVYKFSSTENFTEGTYNTNEDLCNPEIEVDAFCKHNGPCENLRRGLCAMPPFKQPRTLLPPFGDTCPKVSVGDPGWPYDWDWTEEGVPTELVEHPCPYGQNGTAYWRCGEDGDWEGYPDLSDCRMIDTETHLIELDEEDVVPSVVIGDLYKEVSVEEIIAAGDIGGILEVLEKAVDVQNTKIPDQPNTEDYADAFTGESVNLIDDLLGRPIAWLGIEEPEKKTRLSEIQSRMDNISHSLVQYSDSEEHEYNSNSELVKLRVLREVDTDSGQQFSSSGSTIHVATSSGEAGPSTGSISFQAFENFGCILDQRNDCSDLSTNQTEDLVNSVVLGATLYEGSERVRYGGGSSIVRVVLDFRFSISGEEYNLSTPSCRYWDVATDEWSTEGCNLTYSDNTTARCECSHLTNFGVILDVNGQLVELVILNEVLTWITILGCALSIISLVICLYVFTFVRGLRGERTTIHRNLCLCLLVAELLLLFGLDATANSGVCVAVAVLMHYFFLSAFSWMLVEGIQVYNMLVKVFDRARSSMWIYYLVGYGVPALVVALCVALSEGIGMGGYGSELYCWLDYRTGLIWAFAAPVCLVIGVNSFMFLKAMLIARKTMRNRKNLSMDETKRTVTLIKGSFSLLCILGLTWLLGFTYFIPHMEWMSVPFTLLNSFQGVFILIFHVVLNERAKQEIFKTGRKNVGRVRAFVAGQPYHSSSPGGSKDSDASQSGVNAGANNGALADGEGRISSVVFTSGVDLNANSSSVATITTIVEDSTDDKRESPNGPTVRYFRGTITMDIIDSDKSRTPSPINPPTRTPSPYQISKSRSPSPFAYPPKSRTRTPSPYYARTNSTSPESRRRDVSKSPQPRRRNDTAKS